MSGPPGLPAALHPLVRDFLAADGPRSVLGEGQTPAHFVFPEIFDENLSALRRVLDRHGVAHRICYAHKVNQSEAFVRSAERAGIGIDVASPAEYSCARAAGFDTTRIEATGPKDERFLRTLLESGTTINVDNLWELEVIAASGREATVLLRVSGFEASAPSRFGIDLAEVGRAFALLEAAGERITLLGFAFHLDSGEQAERLRAVAVCLDLVEQAHRRGHVPSVLDIGGGLRQVFTADADRFDGYVRALRSSLLGTGEAMSWGATTFGYQVAGGTVQGVPVFHKYANTVTAARMLEDMLTAALPGHGRGMSRVLSDNLLTLWLEPGKALVDHAGLTVATVMFVKRCADGRILVTVDLSRDTVTPADQEVMVDPIVLPTRPPDDSGPVGVYLAGRLCLERDLVTQHKVWLPALPRAGDLVVFPNTAAYHMDLSAATASMYPRAPKLRVVRSENGFEVTPDRPDAAANEAGRIAPARVVVREGAR